MYKISDYPQIQNNFFLGGRNTGASRKLVGDVNVVTVFLKRRPTDWSGSVKTLYYSTINNALNLLMKEATKYGVSLNLKPLYLETTVPADVDSHKGYDIVKDYFHRSTMEELQSYYESNMGVDEVPIILAFEGEDISFAFKDNANLNYKSQELSVIFFNRNDDLTYKKHTIAHELLHQFGAIDYYYPKSVTDVAKKYLHNSIMGIGSHVVDDFTAYLIGWKDTISAGTYWFLKETMWMNGQRYAEEVRNEWKRRT